MKLLCPHSGNALLPWTKLKPLIILKLEKVIENTTNEEEDLSFLDEKIQVGRSPYIMYLTNLLIQNMPPLS